MSIPKRKKSDPKVGTGKKPKGSGRRLYTDENPKDTVSIKFATVSDAKATIYKVKKIKKPYARKIQILTVLEQRAKVSGKNEQASLAKKAKAQLKRKKENEKGYRGSSKAQMGTRRSVEVKRSLKEGQNLLLRGLGDGRETEGLCPLGKHLTV